MGTEQHWGAITLATLGRHQRVFAFLRGGDAREIVDSKDRNPLLEMSRNPARVHDRSTSLSHFGIYFTSENILVNVVDYGLINPFLTSPVSNCETYKGFISALVSCKERY